MLAASRCTRPSGRSTPPTSRPTARLGSAPGRSRSLPAQCARVSVRMENISIRLFRTTASSAPRTRTSPRCMPSSCRCPPCAPKHLPTSLYFPSMCAGDWRCGSGCTSIRRSEARPRPVRWAMANTLSRVSATAGRAIRRAHASSAKTCSASTTAEKPRAGTHTRSTSTTARRFPGTRRPLRSTCVTVGIRSTASRAVRWASSPTTSRPPRPRTSKRWRSTWCH